MTARLPRSFALVAALTMSILAQLGHAQEDEDVRQIN